MAKHDIVSLESAWRDTVTPADLPSEKEMIDTIGLKYYQPMACVQRRNTNSGPEWMIDATFASSCDASEYKAMMEKSEEAYPEIEYRTVFLYV